MAYYKWVPKAVSPSDVSFSAADGIHDAFGKDAFEEDADAFGKHTFAEDADAFGKDASAEDFAELPSLKLPSRPSSISWDNSRRAYVDKSAPNTFDVTPNHKLPSLLVQVSGSKEAVRIPLLPRFTRSSEPATPTSGDCFEKYLSRELGKNVSAIYYPVAKEGNTRGGAGSTTLQMFEKDVLGGNHAYPFVGGMKVVVCIDGQIEPQKDGVKCHQCSGGCSLM